MTTTTDTPPASLNMLSFQLYLSQLVTEMGPEKAYASLEEMLRVHNMVIEAFPDPETRIQCLDEALEVHIMMEDAALQGSHFPAMLPPSLIDVREDAEEHAYRVSKVVPANANTAARTVHVFPPSAT